MSLLTKENLDANDDIGRERLKETNDFDNNFRDVTRERALKIYKNELNRPSSIDLGLHGVTRAALRTLCKNVVLESSKSMKRRYSYSALSSSIHSLINNGNNNAISALRMLQKERLIVSRLGFPDKAMELDKEIEIMREKAKKARAEEEAKILYQRMKTLAITHHRKEQRLEFILAEETRQMNDRFEDEERKLLKRQEIDFLRVLENATRRAIGRVKKCNCEKPYTCRHNKTASYNTRRPTHQVVQYRRNAKRLKRAGRPEEAAAWEEKAKELDEQEQERWRARIAESIVSSPWGANEAAVDQITELHKRELAVLRKTHEVKRDMHEKKQNMRRKNFRNTILAEERKVRMQCRKQALLRVRRDYDKEQRESKRQEKLAGHSDGLKNISKNLLGEQFDDDEKKQVDWVPPTSFGLDNSVRLIDAVKELNPGVVTAIDSENVSGRILTSKKDIAQMTPEELRAKIHSNLKRDNSDEDSDSDEGGVNNDDGNDDIVYKLGVTSGSKLVDNLRQNKANKKEDPTSPFSPTSPSLASSTTALGAWPGVNNPTTFGGFPVNNNSMFPAPNAMAASPFPTTPSTAAFNVTPMSNGFGLGGNSNNAFWGNTAAGTGNPFGSWNNNNNPFNTNPAANPGQVAVPAPAQPSTPAPSAPSFRTGMHLAGTPQQNNPEPKASAITTTIPFPAMNQQQQPSSSSMQQQFQQQMSTAGQLHDAANNQPVTPASPGPAEDFDADDSRSVDRGSEQDGKGSVVSTAIVTNKKTLPGRKVYVFDPVDDTKPVLFKPGSVKDYDWIEHDRALAAGNGMENSYGVSTIDKNIASNNVSSENAADGNANDASVVSPQASPSKSSVVSPDASTKVKSAVKESGNEATNPVVKESMNQTTASFPTTPITSTNNNHNISSVATSFPVSSFNAFTATLQPFPASVDTNPSMGNNNANFLNGNMSFGNGGFGMGMGNPTLFGNTSNPFATSSNPFTATNSNAFATANFPVTSNASIGVANQSSNDATTSNGIGSSASMFNSSNSFGSAPVNMQQHQQQEVFVSPQPLSTMPTTKPLEADMAKLTLTVPSTSQSTPMTLETTFPNDTKPTVDMLQSNNDDVNNTKNALSASWNGSQNSPILRFGHHHEPPTPGTPESVPTKSALSHQSHYNKKGVSLTKTEAKKSVQFGVNEVVTFETPVVEEETEVEAAPVVPLANVTKTGKAKKKKVTTAAPALAEAHETSSNGSSAIDEDIKPLDMDDEPSSPTEVHVPSDMDQREKEKLLHNYVAHHPASSLKDIEEIKEELENPSQSHTHHLLQDDNEDKADTQGLQPPGNAQVASQLGSFGTMNPSSAVSFPWGNNNQSSVANPFASGMNNINPFNNAGNPFGSMPTPTFTQPQQQPQQSVVPSSAGIVPHVPATPKPELTGFQRPAAKLHPSQSDHSQVIHTDNPNNHNNPSVALDAHEIQQIQSIASQVPADFSTKSSMDMTRMSMISMNSIGGVSATNANLSSATSTRSSLDMTMTEQEPVSFVEEEKPDIMRPKPSNSPPTVLPVTQAKIENVTVESSSNTMNNNGFSGANNNQSNPFNASWGSTTSNFNVNNNNNNNINNNNFMASSFGSTMSNPFGTMSSSFPGASTNNTGPLGSTLSFMPSATPTAASSNSSFPFANNSAPFNNNNNNNNNNNAPFGTMSFPTTTSFPSFPNNLAPSVVTPTMAEVHQATHPPSLAHPHIMDLSQDYQHETQSASTDDTTYLMKGGPNWDLALFRIANLDNVHQTLEFILNDDDLYEAAELYLSTIGSYHHDHVNAPEGDHAMERDDSEDHEKELHVHELNMKLQLLRGWKRYLNNAEDNEGLLMGLEEVLGLEQEDIIDHLTDCLKHNEPKLQQIFQELAFAFVPEFVLSSDFEAYFETHSPVKAHNKKLRIDSKSWLGKFQKVVNAHSVPFHLFLFHGGSDHRPYANQRMRAIFGPMCDAPSPKEYIDSSHNDQQSVQAFLSALQNGQDVSSGIICRTLKNGRPPAILSVKHMHSFKHPEIIKYSLVIYHDMSQPDAELKLKVVQAILKSIPSS